uniref:Uncharacterized protein n=1 Tax=Arundo donax TaxID=35708 RepID=A0A0A8ZWK7_ARUDO
MRPAVRRGR